MHAGMVYGLLDQARAMDGCETVSFNYYNEPLLDSRLCDFGRHAKRLGFEKVMFATNGDLIDEPMAKRLDGCFDVISVSLYENNHSLRRQLLKSWFSKTVLRFTHGLHFRIHCFSGDDSELERLIDSRCANASRNVVINHRGDFLACCQEIVPHFNLGNVYDTSLRDLWDAKGHVNATLGRTGGRRQYPYCATCLRGSRKDYVKVVSLCACQ